MKTLHFRFKRVLLKKEFFNPAIKRKRKSG